MRLETIDILAPGLATLAIVYFVATRFYEIFLMLNNVWRYHEDEKRQEHWDTETVLHSRFTIPVSIIISGSSHFMELRQSLDALVRQDYPEFEVITVLHPERLDWFHRLNLIYHFEPRIYFFSRILRTRPVKQIYQSQRYPGLSLIIKDPENGADDLNAAVNLSRYRYVARVPAGVVLHDDALLRLIRPALQNPSKVVGVNAPIQGAITENRAPRWLARSKFLQVLWQKFQQLDGYGKTLLQEFLSDSGKIWLGSDSKPRRDACSLWRRDLLLNVGGFSVGGEIELSLKLRKFCCAQFQSCQFWGLAQPIGTRTLASVETRREMNQGADSLTTLWPQRHALMDRHEFGRAGWLFLPYLWLSQRVARWCEPVMVILLALAAILQCISWSVIILLITMAAGTWLWLSQIASWHNQSSRGTYDCPPYGDSRTSPLS